MHFPNHTLSTIVAFGALCWTGLLPADEPSPAGDPAQIFESLDKNKDGKLTADEITADHREHFDRLLRAGDKDRDGVLTKEEFLAAFARQNPPLDPGPGGPGGRGGDGPMFSLADLFEHFDKNNDGKLTTDELPEKLRERLKPLFTRLNKDALTKEDLEKLRPQMRDNGPGPNGGNPREFLARLDQNKDGKLSRSEIPEPLRDRFNPVFERLGTDSIDLDRAVEIAQQFANGPGRGEGRRPEGGGEPREGRRPEGAGERGPEGPGEGRRPDNGPGRGEGRPGEPPREGMRRLPRLFELADLDHDGRLSKDEFAEMPKLFAELDRNKDGFLDPAELMGPPPEGDREGRRPEGGPDGRRPEGGPEGRRAGGEGNRLNPEELFKNLDKDGDGFLSKEEAPERMKEHFADIDTDKDGKLSKEEVRKSFERLREGGRPERKKPE